MKSRKEKIRNSLNEAKEFLDDIIKRLHNGKGLNELKISIWNAYSLVEYAIGIAKLELKNVSSRKYKPMNSENQRDVILFAYDKVSEALILLTKDVFKALDCMRDARDTLKEVLISIRPTRRKD